MNGKSQDVLQKWGQGFMEEISIGNIKIHNVTLDEAIAEALSCAEAPAWVVTPNAVMLDACAKSGELADLLNRATLSLADGVGVMLAARRQGTPLKERIAGISFGERLLEEAARRGFRVFLLGGGEGVAEGAAENLRKRYPKLTVCGTAWGYFEKGGEEEGRIVSRICASRPDILFVCLGFPLQEMWIAEHLSLLGGIRVVAGLGGALDVWSGRLRRAPQLLSHMGLEWAWRMALQPKRLKHLPAVVRCAFWRGK